MHLIKNRGGEKFDNRRLTASSLAVRSLLFVFFLFSLFGSAMAQGNTNGEFVGQVIEAATGDPMSGAIIQFINQANNSTTAARSDQNGLFRKTVLAPGNYLIRVTYPGYTTIEVKQFLVATRPNTLIPKPFPLVKETAVAVISPSPVQTPSPSGSQVQPQPSPAPTATPVSATPTGSISVNTARKDFATDEDLAITLNPRRDSAFTDSEIDKLPLGGTTLTRSFDELALMAPGVVPAPQTIGGAAVGPGVGPGVGTSGQFSVNGLRSRANNFTVDGSDNNDEDIGVRRQGFFALVPQTIESIQEFQIITLLAPAQFGRNLGAQVNANSKGGGNRFHGTLYTLFNSNLFNARDYFDNAGGDSTTFLTRDGTANTSQVLLYNNETDFFANRSNPIRLFNTAGKEDSLTLFQGGGTLGGPIVNNKLFFFVSSEGQVLNAVKESHFAVPTVKQRSVFNSPGGLQQPCYSIYEILCYFENYVPGYPTSEAGDAVFSLFPFPNDPNGIYGRNTYTQALSADARGAIFSGRLDYNFHKFNNNLQTFTARYNFTNDRRDLPEVGGAIFSAIQPRVRTDNLSTFLNGGLTNKLSNEFRFSWGKTNLEFNELKDATGFLLPVSNSQDSRFLLNARLLENYTLPICFANGCVGGAQTEYVITGNTAANSSLGSIGQIIIPGFSPVGVDVFNFPQERTNNTFQLADTLRAQLSSHLLSFGTDIRRTFLDSNLPRNSRPLVTFNSGLRTNGTFASPLDLAAAGAATGFFQTLTGSGNDARINLSYYQLNFFVQDEWRPVSNLSLSLGLRYEYNTTPKEADKKIESTFGTTFPGYLTGLGSFIDGRKSIYESDRNNFAPRVSIAYSPFSSTVIRGGFGVYYDQILGAVVSQSRNVYPTFVTGNFGGGEIIDNMGFVNFFANNLGQFTLFNPINAVYDPVSQIVCNRTDTLPACNLSRSITLLQPGSLNRFNSALTPDQLRLALLDITRYFPNDNSRSLYGATLPTKKLDSPFSYQYSIGVEQKLFRNTFLSVAYVGTTGRDLLRFTTPNLGSNFLVTQFTYSLFDPNGEYNDGQPIGVGTTSSPLRPTANVGAINRFETTGRSRYDSLQIEMRGRLSRVFQYNASYVYGMVKDDVSDVFDLAGAFVLPQNSRTFEGEYAPANFDVRHRFTYNFIYDLPGLKGSGAFFRALFSDWQIAGTGRFYTGQPFTVNTIYDVNQDGNLTDRLNNTKYIVVTGDRRQPLRLSTTDSSKWFEMLAPLGANGAISRNSFRAGNILDLDMSVAKNFKITESQAFQLRVDFFNFLNHPNFGIPVRILEAPNFGEAVNTITPGRRIQFGLKYIF